MDRQEELRQWFSIAAEDLRSAEYLATMRYPTPDAIICFHCQQSAEKYLKGFLFQNNIDPPKIHDVPELLRLCGPIMPEYKTILTQCAFLNQFSVIPRYPQEIQITADDVKTALRYAAEVKDFISRL